MAGTKDDHNTVNSLDDVFQILIARDYPPFDAKEEIDEALRPGKLRVDQHIKAGARKTSPTPEGRKAQIEGRSADVTYEVCPPGGITQPVNPQSWGGRLFDLMIQDGRLIVTPCCSLDWPWEAYSFSIANPVVINELWSPAASNRLLPATTPSPQPSEPSSPSPPKRLSGRKWLFREFADNPISAGKDQSDYLRDIHSKMGKDSTTRRQVDLKSVQNRYTEFLRLPQKEAAKWKSRKK
jgi:hypothetical protein